MAPIRELTTLGDLDRAVTGGATSMLGWRVADLDLSTRGAQLTGLDGLVQPDNDDAGSASGVSGARRTGGSSRECLRP